ncbi:MAG: hypothetical protein KBB33_07355 [Candidatus Cloacimonetes bacterium]|nr:hypothetical protein [Candidatus Cloacimonadota bacterium]HPI24992.1 hypothetical protein [Candidatus Cloacimonadota bacterium]
MNRYRIEYSLIVLLPVIAALIGAILAGIPMITGDLGTWHIAVGAGLCSGLIALFYRYIEGKSLWYVVLGLPILLAIVVFFMIPASVSIFSLVLPNLAFSLAMYAMIRYIYYARNMIRLRTLLMGITGGLVFSGYITALSKLAGPDDSMFLRDVLMQSANTRLLNGLIIFVFISFAMSVADLIIVQIEVKRMKAEADQPDD